MQTFTYSPLRWGQEYDDNDNTIWTAASCTASEPGSPCYYKLHQRLERDHVLWYSDSDSELGGNEDPWSSLEEAKMELERQNKETWDQALAAGELTLGEVE